MLDEGRSSTHREAVLDAAVRALAVGGVPGLTDRAVDDAGGLPPGSTEALFPDAASLFGAVVDELTRRDGVLWTQLGDLTPSSLGEFAERMAQWVSLSLTVEPVAARARMQLFLGAADRAAVGHMAILDVVTVVLDVLGVPDPDARGRLVVDLVSGAVIAHCTVRSGEGFDQEAFADGARRMLLGR